MKRNLVKIFSLAFLFSLLLGCENNLEMTLPQGPQGEKGDKGDKGDPGLSAFDLWKEYYGKDPNTSIEEFFNSLKGKDGEDGAVPVIGENGNWIINGVDTGIPARGQDGKDGVTPEIGANGNWFIDGRDTGVPARGKDGFTPYVKDGNWWIGDNDTGVPARGQDGINGRTPTVEIGPGPDYFWIIDGTTTPISAKGVDGKDGFTPVIGPNGNWFMNGEDTGKPSKGEDGKTPTVEIGPGPDYFWIIDGTTTTITAKGKDGYTPVIGDNGNWFIGGEDTGKPSVVIPVIGDNGNWYIDGVDTGKPARGPKGDNGEDGVDGKTAYELWKEAVDLCDGTVKNKDGSAYDCSKNTWEDFLIWLQGGDISVLHQYWTTLPGNDGKTIQEFIDALFSCHCDGITIIVLAPNECVTLNAGGEVTGTYNATLKVGGDAGTQVQITGGFNGSGTIAAGQTEVSFTIPRGDADKILTIQCTFTNSQQVDKTATIPALKYIKLGEGTPVTVTKVDGEEKDVVSITFATVPSEVLVGTTVIYEGAEAKDGWTTTDGKTFTKTYDRSANVQNFNVQAKGANGECSTLNNLFSIPQLTPVTITEDPVLAKIDGNNCDLLLTLQGTSGMTVTATYGSNPATTVTLTESPTGTYTTSDIPRTYNAYNVTVTAAMEGAGTVTRTVNVSGTNLLENQNPLTGHNLVIPGETENTQIALIKRRLTNTTNASLTVRFTRTAGNGIQQGVPFPFEQTIPAGGFIDVEFHRNYTSTYGTGNYVITMKTINECGLEKDYTLTVQNLSSYHAKFSKPDNWGGPGQPGGPDWDYETDGDPDITFTVEVFDGLPNKYVEFQLFKGVGYSAIFRGQVGANGRLTQTVTMKASELEAALNDGSAFFKFFDNPDYTGAINIGATKERIDFAFD